MTHRILDLDVQRRAIVGKIQLNGETHDVLPCSLADAEVIAAASCVDDVVAAVRTVVPTLDEQTVRALSFQMAKAILELAVGTLAASGAGSNPRGIYS